MNWQNIDAQQLAQNVGWTLIHSLWQISLVAFLLFLSLRILKKASANLRYLLSAAALFLTVAMSAATFISFLPHRKAVENPASLPINANAPNTSAYGSGGKNAPVKVSPGFPGAESIDEKRTPETVGSLINRAENTLAGTLPYVIWVWLFGVLCFSFRFCGGIWQVNRLKKRGVGGIGEEWQAKFNEVCEKARVRGSVEFLQSEFVGTPMVIGWIKPLVIVPSSVLLNLNPRELETIIAHELIHVRRHDYLVNILQSFVEIFLFFHPLTWWISGQIRRERENVCDDEVLKIFSGDTLLYASALANLEDFRAKSLTPVNIVAANGGNLMMRIQRIIKKSAENNRNKESFPSILPVFLFFAAFLSGVLLTGWYISTDQTAADKNETVAGGRANKIAVGLYSGSIVLPSENSAEDDEKIMRIIVSKLKQHNIPTTGFLKGVDVVPQAQTVTPAQEQTINLWRSAGFEIGVLDLKHPQSFNSTTDEYRKVLKSKEDKFKSLLDKHKPLLEKQLQLYREIKKSKTQKSSGKDTRATLKFTKEYMDEFKKFYEEWRRENNLINVKYTFGTDDWIYSFAYDRARKNNDRAMMDQIKARYIVYMSKLFEHYESYARQLFERDIPQTLPLTPSRLLADSADELFAMIETRNYQFISLDEAMRDEIYQSDLMHSNQTGASWLQTAALKRKKPYLNEPEVDADTTKIWEDSQPLNLKVVEQ